MDTRVVVDRKFRRVWPALAAALLVLAVTQVVPGSADAAVPPCTITGTAGQDALTGGAGADVICGLGDADHLVGAGGNDYLSGGAGNDTLDGRDASGNVDVLDCGTGSADKAFADQRDEVIDCEIVTQEATSPSVTLSPSAVAENQSAGTEVGLLSVLNGRPVSEYAFTLVSGPGSGDNGSFTIVGRSLRTAASFDFETKSSYAIRVRATARGSEIFEQFFTVTVTDVVEDVAPVAVNDSATVLEDASATAVPVLSNDTDVDGGPKVIASASDPTHGTVTLTGGTPGAHTGLTYQPDPNYCNNPPGGAPDTFTYTLNGGSTATVSITVTCVEDQPTPVGDARIVNEDAPATAFTVLANDTDPDGGAITITSASDPANGTVVLTGGSPGAHTGLTYQPDPNYCNNPPGTTVDTFTYTINGGSTATVTVMVTCVDDAPVAVADGATVDEGAPATAIPVLANDTDIDGGPITIGSATDPANGTVVLTGGTPGAHTGLTYQPDPGYCNDPPGISNDVFDYTLTTGSTATVNVRVTCFDDNPVAVDDSATVLQDASATAVPVLDNDTDVDGGTKVIASASDPANGTVVLTGGTPGAHPGLTYQPDPGYCNDPPGTSLDTFTYTLNGGSTATVSVKVTCDAPPTAVNDSATVLQDASATAIPVLNNDTDTDGGPKVITAASDPANGSVVLTGGTPGAHTGLTYQPDPGYCNDPPGGAPDTFTYTLNGGSSATVSMTVTCAPVNAAPVVDLDAAGGLTYAEGDGYQNLFGANATITDPDSPTLSSVKVTLTAGFDATYDDVRLNPATSGFTTNFTGGVLTITRAGGTVAQFQDALRNVQFHNTDDDPDNRNDGTPNPSFLNRTVSVVADDGGPGGTSTPVTRDVTITPVNDAPSVPGIAPTTVGVRNTTLVTTGVTATEPHSTRSSVNFVGTSMDPDGLESAITVAPVTAAATAQNGRITLTGDGDLRYEPPASASLNSDTYGYSLTDGTTSSAPITFTVNFAGWVWYVADGASAPMDGTAARPFDTVAAALAVAGTEPIHIRRGSGDGILTGTAVLAPADRLFGEGVALTNTDVGSAVDETLFPAGTKPVLTAASGSDVVTLASTTQVRGLSINPDGAANGLFGNNVSGVILGTVDVTDTGTAATQPGIEITGTGNGLTFNAPVSLSTTQAGALSISNAALAGNIASTSVSGSTTSPGISLTNTTGSLTFATVAVTTTNQTGIALSNAGTIRVTGSANTIQTGTGTALSVVDTTIGSGGLNFRSIAANGAVSGIVLDNTGDTAGLTVTGTGAAPSGGTIQNTTGPGVSLTDTNDVALNNVAINGANRSGVEGVGVTGFSFTNGTITNAGDSQADDDDSSIAFNDTAGGQNNNVDGAVTITNNTLTNAFGAGIEIFQYAGTITNATITGNIISSTFDPATSRRSGIALNLFGSTTTVASLIRADISDNTVTGFPSGDGISVQGANTASATAPPGTYGVPGSATDVVSFTGNQVIGDATNKMNGFGISASVTGRGQGNFSITDNGPAGSPLRNMKSSAIAIGAAGDVTAYFVVDNNRIDANNGFGSSALALGTDKNIQADLSTLSTPIVRATITNNVVEDSDGAGIRVLHGDSNGTVDLRLEDNTVINPKSSSIVINDGSSGNVAYNPSMCASIDDNVAPAGQLDGFGDTPPGMILDKNSDSATTYKFGIVGLSPSPATPLQTEAFVLGNNPSTGTGGGFWAGKKVAVSDGDNFTSCTLPAGM